METVIKRLLHEERKTKKKGQDSTSAATSQEVMSVRHKKRGPMCYFCKNFGINKKLLYVQMRKEVGIGRQRD